MDRLTCLPWLSLQSRPSPLGNRRSRIPRSRSGTTTARLRIGITCGSHQASPALEARPPALFPVQGPSLLSCSNNRPASGSHGTEPQPSGPNRAATQLKPAPDLPKSAPARPRRSSPSTSNASARSVTQPPTGTPPNPPPRLASNPYKPNRRRRLPHPTNYPPTITKTPIPPAGGIKPLRNSTSSIPSILPGPAKPSQPRLPLRNPGSNLLLLRLLLGPITPTTTTPFHPFHSSSNRNNPPPTSRNPPLADRRDTSPPRPARPARRGRSSWPSGAGRTRRRR